MKIMKKINVLAGLMLALVTASCSVNRYGVGEYADATKSEIKEKFVSERKSGNIGLRQAQGQAIGGLVPINYVNPADLAKTDNYIVTTKVSALDIVVNTLTGGLYSQSTVHVISLYDNETSTVTKTTSYSEPLNIKIRPQFEIGLQHNFHNPTNEYSKPYSDGLRNTGSYFGNIGANIEVDNLFADVSFGGEYQSFDQKTRYDNLDYSDADEVTYTSSPKVFLANTEILFGYKLDKISLFTGIKANKVISDKYEGKSVTRLNGLQTGEYDFEDLEFFNRDNSLLLPVGFQYNFEDNLSLRFKYNFGLQNRNNFVDFNTLQVGTVIKL